MPILVKIGHPVLEKRILKYFESKFTISVLSPLGVERGPLLEQTCLIEIGPVVQEKKLKI